ncbi:RNA polymerase recycling motor ATPase HelR [Promicromonospora sp. Populi]|uniref:RNA polymerase recycling motor ATPase HelR n=1 Tax=Promicromonospora sp. Populi TaxID=3239420 RepID=UPI0034E2C579
MTSPDLKSLSTATSESTAVFDLPGRLAAKADPTLTAADERHFADIATTLEQSIADLTERLDAARRLPATMGQAAVERDQEVHRLTSRLRTMRRFGVDLCLGRMISVEAGIGPVYVGRLGLTDSAGRRLLIDWRSPAAEPFFGATHADPMGLASRRRYRWTRGRVTDFWDEVFTPDLLGSGAQDGAEGPSGSAAYAALDDQSAFIASLGGERSDRMRDVLGTIQADQDAIIRAGSRGALVVDGGPGTGKTVVALHRTAYLLYSDPRLGHRRGGVLFVGPHQPYLAYVSDVLPSLGEEGVQTCTVRDLVPEGRTAPAERDPEVARLKADARMVAAIEPAVRLYETPPKEGMAVAAPWGDVWVSTADWAEAFGVVEAGTAHNEARDQVWAALLTILTDKVKADDGDGDGSDDEGGWSEDRWSEDGAEPSDDLPADWRDWTEDRLEDQFDAYGQQEVDPTAPVRAALAGNRDLARAFDRAWPLLEPMDIVGDLWEVPAYLRMCAPWLEPDAAARLRRDEPKAWTGSDLPILDAARRRIGDPEASRRRRRAEAAAAAERARMADVVDDLIATDDSDMGVMQMLHGQDLREALLDGAAVPATADPDLLAGPFAHIVVDEAQELTDAEWQMLLARCPSRSLTVVGDRAQARHGFAESWTERLGRVGLGRIETMSLGINYRTPAEIMAEAEPVIRAALPDANVPTSVRSSGFPVLHGAAAQLGPILEDWLAEHTDGTACVISTRDDLAIGATPRVRLLTPELSKGLEFDLVVLVDPESFGADKGAGDQGTGRGVGIERAVDRYVAMTRATQRLVILTTV